MKQRGRVLFPLLLLVALLAAGAAAYYFFFLRGASGDNEPQEETFEIALTDLTVNLADQDRSHYLSASITIVIKGIHAEAAAEEFDAAIRDAVIIVTTQHTYQELLSADGKDRLKRDIQTAVEQSLAGEHLAVEDVLFVSFVMD